MCCLLFDSPPCSVPPCLSFREFLCASPCLLVPLLCAVLCVRLPLGSASATVRPPPRPEHSLSQDRSFVCLLAPPVHHVHLHCGATCLWAVLCFLLACRWAPLCDCPLSGEPLSVLCRPSVLLCPVLPHCVSPAYLCCVWYNCGFLFGGGTLDDALAAALGRDDWTSSGNQWGPLWDNRGGDGQDHSTNKLKDD